MKAQNLIIILLIAGAVILLLTRSKKGQAKTAKPLNPMYIHRDIAEQLKALGEARFTDKMVQENGLDREQVVNQLIPKLKQRFE